MVENRKKQTKGIKKSKAKKVKKKKVAKVESSDAVVEKKNTDLRLIIDGEDARVHSATVLLRWCISRNMMNIVEHVISENFSRGVVPKPCILISVVSERREVSRDLLPLDQMMSYVQLHKAGVNKIHAAIVWSFNGYNNLWKELMARRRYGYSTDIISWDGSIFTSNLECRVIGEPANMEVDVPEELFAKEPAEWEKNWVNRWFRDKQVDQCAFRKRIPCSARAAAS